MIKREIRFYVCLLMAFVLVAYGAHTPPPGEVSQTIIAVAAMFLIVGAVAVGVDVVAIIHAFGDVVAQVRALKTAELNKLNSNESNNAAT